MSPTHDLSTAQIVIGSVTPDKLAALLFDCDPKLCQHQPGIIACRQAVENSYKTPDAVNNTEALPLCIMCPAPGTLRCDSCEEARYCSEACKNLDWKYHEPLCISFKENCFQDDHRPSPQHVRVLVYPQSKTAPEFYWARAVGVDSLQLDRPVLAKYLCNNPARKIESINVGLGLPKIGHGLHIHFAPTRHEEHPGAGSFILKPFLNQSIAALGPPGHLDPVYAHAIVFAFESDGSEISKLTDVSFRDARHTVDWLLQRPSNPAVVDVERYKTMQPHSTVVPAIKFNDLSEPAVSTLGLSKNQSTEEIWTALDRKKDFRPCVVPITLGLRYWIRLPQRRHVLTQPEKHYMQSFPGWPLSTYFELSLHEPKTPAENAPVQFDYTIRDWHVVSLTLVHSSGEAIPPAHCEALFEFFIHAHNSRKAMVAGESATWPTWLLEKLGEDGIKEKLGSFNPNPHAFGVFWDLWKEYKGYEGIESPFDLEERTKGSSVFMDAEGKWPALGVRDYNYAESLESSRKRALATAKLAGHTIDLRASETAEHNGGQARSFDEPTHEDMWHRDSKTLAAIMRFKVKKEEQPRPKPIPALFPNQTASLVPDPSGNSNGAVMVNLPPGSLSGLAEEMSRLNPDGGPVTFNDPQYGEMQTTIMNVDSPEAREILRRMGGGGHRG